MTTIATDGKTMAADGRSVGDGSIGSDSLTKLRQLANGAIAGWVGVGALGPVFFDWLDSQEAQKPNARFPGREETSSGLVLNPDGTVSYWGPVGYPIERDLPAADGSGMELAIGAMLAGASPQKAVEIAAQRDPGTGGRITSLNR